MKLMDQPPLSFAHLGALEIGPPQLIDLLAQAGFSSTGIRMRRAAPGTPEYALSDPALRRQTRRRIAETGLGVLYIELVVLAKDLDIQDLCGMLEAGAEIGATRIVAAGGDEDLAIVAEKLAGVSELAHPFGMAVDLEFMPFRPVRSLEEAVQVLAMARQPNAHVLLDALHFFRSGSSLETLRRLDPKLLGSLQLCDAPVEPPADLAYEARNTRLLPDRGGLALDALMDVLPPDLPIGVEVPLAMEFPDLDALARARLTATETRNFLARRARREMAR
jgi:sugar phosphate isomerase/epimerase